MRRQLFTILSVVSLVLFAATCMLWVRSYTAADSIRWNVPPHGGVLFLSSKGRFTLSIYPGVDGMVSGFQHVSQPLFDFDEEWRRWFATYRNVLGFGFGTGLSGGVPLIVPYWSMALLTFLLSTWVPTRYWLAERRLRLGLCAACGYDLRATPDRCPECGTVPAAKVTA